MKVFQALSVFGDLRNKDLKQESFFVYLYLGFRVTYHEEQVHQTTIDDETTIMCCFTHSFIQTSDVIDTESVLPLTTL